MRAPRDGKHDRYRVVPDSHSQHQVQHRAERDTDHAHPLELAQLARVIAHDELVVERGAEDRHDPQNPGVLRNLATTIGRSVSAAGLGAVTD